MNKLIILGLSSAIAFSYSFIPNYQVKAVEKRTFTCEKTTNQSLPKTFTLYEGQKRTLIHWAGALGGKTPQKRCEQAALNLQKAYDNDTLIFITNGIMKKQPVICTADDYGGSCVNLLITLNPQENSLKVLNQLKEAFLGEQIGPIINNSGVPQIYYEIDLEQAIKNAPVEP